MNEIKTVLSEIGGALTGAGWYQMVKWPFWVLLFTVAAGGVYCARFGKKTLLCRSVSGTLNLCGIYQTAFILYTVFPTFRKLPFPLPFLTVTTESVAMQNFLSMDLVTLAPILLQLLVLQLLVDFVEHLNPGGKTVVSWLVSQVVTMVISLSAYLIGTAGVSFLLSHFMQPSMSQKLAVIPLLIVGIILLVMLCAKLIFTVVLETGNPTFKKHYDFFTTNKIGSLLTVSTMSFLLTCGVFAVLFATGNSKLTFASGNLWGMLIILALLLVAEFYFAMYFCGKKK